MVTVAGRRALMRMSMGFHSESGVGVPGFPFTSAWQDNCRPRSSDMMRRTLGFACENADVGAAHRVRSIRIRLRFIYLG